MNSPPIKVEVEVVPTEVVSHGGDDAMLSRAFKDLPQNVSEEAAVWRELIQAVDVAVKLRQARKFDHCRAQLHLIIHNAKRVEEML